MKWALFCQRENVIDLRVAQLAFYHYHTVRMIMVNTVAYPHFIEESRSIAVSVEEGLIQIFIRAPTPTKPPWEARGFNKAT
eukprot:COSAG05_NODE_524_length_8999_cov_4.187528_7_plen_81_part_00